MPDLLGLPRSGLREEYDARFLQQFGPPQRFVPPHQAEQLCVLAFLLAQGEIMESAVKLHEVIKPVGHSIPPPCRFLRVDGLCPAGQPVEHLGFYFALAGAWSNRLSRT